MRRWGWPGADSPASADRDSTPESAAAAAIAAAYVRYAPAIAAYLRRMLGDEETAADLTEMTFEKALRSWDRAPREHLEAWLFRIATNCGRDTYRQCRRWQPLAVLEASQRTVLVAPDAPEREAIRSEQRDLLSQALAQLPARRRAALLFRTKQALSYGEIGTALGITPGAAKQLLFRARQELRVRYLALGGEPLEE